MASTHLNICAIYSHLGRHQEAKDHAEMATKMIEVVSMDENRQTPTNKNINNNSNNDKPNSTLPTVMHTNAIRMLAHYNLAIELEHLRQFQSSQESYQSALESAQLDPVKNQAVINAVKQAVTRLKRQVDDGAKKLMELLKKKKDAQQKGFDRGMRNNRKNASGSTMAFLVDGLNSQSNSHLNNDVLGPRENNNNKSVDNIANRKYMVYRESQFDAKALTHKEGQTAKSHQKLDSSHKQINSKKAKMASTLPGAAKDTVSTLIEPPVSTTRTTKPKIRIITDEEVGRDQGPERQTNYTTTTSGYLPRIGQKKEAKNLSPIKNATTKSKNIRELAEAYNITEYSPGKGTSQSPSQKQNSQQMGIAQQDNPKLFNQSRKRNNRSNRDNQNDLQSGDLLGRSVKQKSYTKSAASNYGSIPSQNVKSVHMEDLTQSKREKLKPLKEIAEKAGVRFNK